MDERRVWEMCRLACFEEDKGEQDIKIASYYRRDYVGLGLLSNLFQVTIAYAILLALIVIVKLDFLMENFDKLNYPVLGAVLIVGYFLILGLYSVLVLTIRRLKYAKAKREITSYYNKLNLVYEDLIDERRKRRLGKEK